MQRFITILVMVMTGLLVACDHKPKSLSSDEYLKWLASEKSGLTKEKKIKGVQVKVRFLPAQYLAYRDWHAADSISYDSILRSYKCGLSFQVDLQADKADKIYGNLMFYDVMDQEAFSARSRFLNFSIQDFISLTDGKVKYEPVLSHFEGYESLGNKLSFRVVYIIPEYNCGVSPKDFKNVTLTFDDPFWDLGIINFQFENTDIVNLPELKL
jgi:hypothetical protein